MSLFLGAKQKKSEIFHKQKLPSRLRLRVCLYQKQWEQFDARVKETQMKWKGLKNYLKISPYTKERLSSTSSSVIQPLCSCSTREQSNLQILAVGLCDLLTPGSAGGCDTRAQAPATVFPPPLPPSWQVGHLARLLVSGALGKHGCP